jgi:fatty acid desaturase
MELTFVPRAELGDREWNNETRQWDRPKIDRETLQELNRRSTSEGMLRLVVHVALILTTAWLTVLAWRYHVLLAVAPFLVYAFLVGFLNGIEHEMRHMIVFSRRLDWFNDLVYFLIHLLWKIGSRNQRVSHRIHHRYTMVKGVDPETAFPEAITRRWVWRVLLGLLATVLTLGIPSFFKMLWDLFQRSRGRLNPRIMAHCDAADLKFIRRESALILIVNVLALAGMAWWQRWDLILLLMLGPQVGLAIVAFWYLTEHIGMMFNANDQRLCTRGVKVTRFVKFLFGGLDEHVEHHLFPAVPSRNLTRLREALDYSIPERRSVLSCWREILAIARHKEKQPGDELEPTMRRTD